MDPTNLKIGDKIHILCDKLNETTRGHSSHEIYVVTDLFDAMGQVGLQIDVRGLKTGIHWRWTPSRDLGECYLAKAKP